MYSAANRIAYQSTSMTDCGSIWEDLLYTPIIGFHLKGGMNMKETCVKNTKYRSGFQFNPASSIRFCVWMKRNAANHLRGFNYQVTRHIHNPLAFVCKRLECSCKLNFWLTSFCPFNNKFRYG